MTFARLPLTIQRSSSLYSSDVGTVIRLRNMVTEDKRLVIEHRCVRSNWQENPISNSYFRLMVLSGGTHLVEQVPNLI